MSEESIAITGIHLRTTGAKNDNHIVVAVEVNGEWFDVISEFAGPIEVSISHFIGVTSIRSRAKLTVAEEER